MTPSKISQRGGVVTAASTCLVLAVAGFIVTATSSPALSQQADGTVAVREPAQLSATARDGKILFERNCAACHGPSASGSENGPPLVHDIYNPGHHGDGSFHNAVQNGARAHHWRFGDMPKVEGVNEPMVGAIIEYVRALQAENGIATIEHRM